MLDNDAWSAVAELAASQHGCFTTSQAAERGVGRRRRDRALRDGLVTRPRPGVFRFGGVAPSWESRASAAVLSTGGVVSHRAAARVHRLDGFDRAPLEITVARGRMPDPDGVVVHRWTEPDPDRDHVVVDGLCCTTVAATLAQLGAVVSPAVLERALDDALRRGVSPVWIRETIERLHRPGPSGTGVARRLLDDPKRSDILPDSWFERLTQRLVEHHGIPAPVLQYEVVGRSGRRYRLDLAWPTLAVGLECHSRRHHFGPSKEAADHRRDLELAASGWEVVYLTWNQRRDPSSFIPDLAEILAVRARQLGLPAA